MSECPPEGLGAELPAREGGRVVGTLKEAWYLHAAGQTGELL